MIITTLCLPTVSSTPIRGVIANAVIASEILTGGNTQLSISFLDLVEMVLSKIDFEFLPLNTITGDNLISFFNEVIGKGAYKIADVYPLNGTAKPGKFSITNFIRPAHRDEIQQHLDQLKDSDDFVRLMVIDFKDTRVAYDNRDEILKTEKAFAKFLREPPPTGKNTETQAKIHKLIRENGINFLINEGTLKADLLLHTFTDPEQRAFFQNKSNSALLCQLCEIIMNGFKQGREVVRRGDSLPSKRLHHGFKCHKLGI